MGSGFVYKLFLYIILSLQRRRIVFKESCTHRRMGVISLLYERSGIYLPHTCMLVVAYITGESLIPL